MEGFHILLSRQGNCSHILLTTGTGMSANLKAQMKSTLHRPCIVVIYSHADDTEKYTNQHTVHDRRIMSQNVYRLSVFSLNMNNHRMSFYTFLVGYPHLQHTSLTLSLVITHQKQ